MQFPDDLAAAAKSLVQKCQTAGLKPPVNPGNYINTWRDRQTAKGDIRSNAHRSGRKPKLTSGNVQAAYKAILAWEKAGRTRPYESAQHVAAECPYVKKLLTRPVPASAPLLQGSKRSTPALVGSYSKSSGT
jgi:hypothetical protein